MSKILLSLPGDLLAKVDELCQEKCFERSEFIRSLIRERVFGGKILATPLITKEEFQETKPFIGDILPDKTSSEKFVKEVLDFCKHGIPVTMCNDCYVDPGFIPLDKSEADPGVYEKFNDPVAIQKRLKRRKK